MSRAAFLDARSCVLELQLRYVYFWIDDFKKDFFVVFPKGFSQENSSSMYADSC